MNLKAFPYKWTCFVGVLFLGSLLWSGTMLDGVGFLLVAVSFLCFLISILASLVRLVLQPSRMNLYRVIMNVVVCILFFPITWLGSFFRERLFLVHLNRFQEATNLLIENEAGAGKDNREVHFTGARLPPGYSNLHVADWVLISSTKESITVRYISRDSSALGHRGYMYRSDDDVVALGKEFPRLGYKRVAPHWFYFFD